MAMNWIDLKPRKTIWNLEEKDHAGNVNGVGEEPEPTVENKRRAAVRKSRREPESVNRNGDGSNEQDL